MRNLDYGIWERGGAGGGRCKTVTTKFTRFAICVLGLLSALDFGILFLFYLF